MLLLAGLCLSGPLLLLALYYHAVMAGAFRDLPPAEVPGASSTTRIVQQVGGSFGAAVLAVILASQLAAHPGLASAARGAAFAAAFWWSTGCTGLAVMPALLLPGAASRGPRSPAPDPGAAADPRGRLRS